MSNIQMYTKGTKDALESLESYLTDSINKHGGVRESHQAVKVLNDLIYYLHKELTSIPDTYEEDEFVGESEILKSLLSDMFNGQMIEFSITKGER